MPGLDIPPMLSATEIATIFNRSPRTLARWVAAGNAADLAIYPGGAHGFTLFPNDLSKAASAKMDDFLNRVLA